MPDTSEAPADPFGAKAGRLRSKVPKLVRQDDAPIDGSSIPRQSKKFDIPSKRLPLPSVAPATSAVIVSLGARRKMYPQATEGGTWPRA